MAGRRQRSRSFQPIIRTNPTSPFPLRGNGSRHAARRCGCGVLQVGSALALQPLMREKERILLLTVAGSSDITGKACSPFGFHFNCDTHALAHSTGQALTRMGGNSWYFTTVDYAFGHALERDTSRFVTDGAARSWEELPIHWGPLTSRSYLVAAQASRAKVIAFCNGGADAQNAIKQAVDFGLGQAASGSPRCCCSSPTCWRWVCRRRRGSSFPTPSMGPERSDPSVDQAVPCPEEPAAEHEPGRGLRGSAPLYPSGSGGRARPKACCGSDARAAGKRHVQRGRADLRRRARVVADVPDASESPLRIPVAGRCLPDPGH